MTFNVKFVSALPPYARFYYREIRICKFYCHSKNWNIYLPRIFFQIVSNDLFSSSFILDFRNSRYKDPALKFWFQEKLGYTNSCLLLKMSIIDFFFENLFFFHKTERFRFLLYLRPPKNQSVKRKRQSQKRMRKRNINTSFKT